MLLSKIFTVPGNYVVLSVYILGDAILLVHRLVRFSAQC